MSMKTYWLVLNYDTFLWQKSDECCVYNSKNNCTLRFVDTGLKRLLATLSETDNLYRVFLDESELLTPTIHFFINQIVSTGSGRLVLNEKETERPVSLMPLLKIQDNINYYKWEHDQHIDGNIMSNFHSVLFYINGSEYGHTNFNKQTYYPNCTIDKLDQKLIVSFLRNAQKSAFFTDVVLAGNIFDYVGYNQLLTELSLFRQQVSLVLTEMDVKNSINEYLKLVPNFIITIVVRDVDILDHLLQYEELRINSLFTFLITSENEYERAADCIDQYSLDRSEIVPIYTGANLSLFETNLYLTKEDIEGTQLNKRQVFAQQALNTHSFGKLSVLPDGKVYANLNDPAIGLITEPPHDIVYRELTEGKSWLRIRDQKPCSECVYQWLCPSPSNYELVIGKPNLCHIKPC